MPFPRPIDSTLHGVTDYTLGTLLMTALPRLAGVEGTESATQMRITGAAHTAYSTLTDYPLGIVKLIPYKAHLAIDALGAVAVGALPFLTGQYRKGPKHFVPHLALAAFELSSLLLSDPRGKGDFHGDVDAVRAANELDPHSRIYNGGSAMPSASARF
jgi:hypothetical protein